MACTISGIKYYVNECFTLDRMKNSHDRYYYPDFFRWFDKQSDSVKDAVLKILQQEAREAMKTGDGYDDCDDDALDLGFAIRLSIRNNELYLGVLGEEVNKYLDFDEREWDDDDWNEWLFVLSDEKYGSKSTRRK